MMPMRRLLEQVSDPTEIASIAAASKREGSHVEDVAFMADFINALKKYKTKCDSGSERAYAKWGKSMGVGSRRLKERVLFLNLF